MVQFVWEFKYFGHTTTNDLCDNNDVQCEVMFAKIIGLASDFRMLVRIVIV